MAFYLTSRSMEHAALNRIIELARQRGSAIGVVSVWPAAIARLERWTNGLDFEGRRIGPALRVDVRSVKAVRSIGRVPQSMSGRLYRPCVGVALVNQAGDAFIGHRKRKRGSEVLDPRSWQMPQGGIDAGEQPLEAAKRELWEETNVSSTELIAELPEWLKYDLPEDARGRWSGRYRGQTQKWFLFRFVGSDKEIDVHHPAGGAHDAEFDDWRWERLERLPELVVPFKREVYEAVAAAFAPLARPAEPVNSGSSSYLPALTEATAAAIASSIFLRRR